jgi:elongation factor G
VTCFWNNTQINLVDTPGHVDFTIEVERALRVLDGAILVMDGVAGVQAQTITVNRQMQRYQIPRLIFINKLDRLGADPWAVLDALHERLDITPVLLQYPIGLEGEFVGVINLIDMQAHYFEGQFGEQWIQRDIPEPLTGAAEAARDRLLDQISILSDTMMVELLEDEAVPQHQIWDTLRRGTINLDFTPVLLGSALKNKGVQPLLDAVIRYLPSPCDRGGITATDIATQHPVKIPPDEEAPLVSLAFKLIEDEYGQLTYTRLYAGTLTAGDHLFNSRTQQLTRLYRLIRIEVDKSQEVEQAVAGDIIGLIGPDCMSGDTLCSPKRRVSLEGMMIPEPVVTIALSPESHDDSARLDKALQRFIKEDPTLRLQTDEETGRLLLSGMGELHLNIYLERIRREYGAHVRTDPPAVAYRETITQPAPFDYTLEQHAGSTGQYAHVSGILEPCDGPYQFESQLSGGMLDASLLEACEAGFLDAAQTGWLKGYPVRNIKVILTGATQRPLESIPATFRFAAYQGFMQAFATAHPVLLEPMMQVEIETPTEYIGILQNKLLARRALLLNSQYRSNVVVLLAKVPLAELFGYATEVRSLSHGLATFSMEFAEYCPLPDELLDSTP